MTGLQHNHVSPFNFCPAAVQTLSRLAGVYHGLTGQGCLIAVWMFRRVRNGVIGFGRARGSACGEFLHNLEIPAIPPDRPTTRAAFVTWRTTSTPKAACRIRHNDCNLCSASPVVKPAFHDNLRQILKSRLRHRFHLNGTARAPAFATLRTIPLKTVVPERRSRGGKRGCL